MARDYVVSFEKVSVSAVQDLFQITGASGKIIQILGFSIDDVDTTAPQDQQIVLRCRYLPATVSNGSGGSSVTPAKVDPGDSAASFTCLANNTSKATTSGTAVVLFEGGANVKAGREFYFSGKPTIGPSEAFVIELITAPATTLTMNGTAWVREMGG
jgi:hypothetical protein